MNDGGSVVEFFYNIIPGSIFILGLQYLYGDKNLNLILYGSTKNDNSQLIFWFLLYITIGLLLGFIFQGLTKFCRDRLGLNDCLAIKVINNNETEFDTVIKKLNKNRVHDKITISKATKAFFLMDNFLRGEQRAFLPTHNSSRFAFWSNIFFATLITIILINFFNFPINLDRLEQAKFLLPILLFVSFYQSYMYFYAYYDTILKSYYMLTEYKNKSITIDK